MMTTILATQTHAVSDEEQRLLSTDASWFFWAIVDVLNGQDAIGKAAILTDGSVLVFVLREGSEPVRTWYPAHRIERVEWLADEQAARRLKVPRDAKPCDKHVPSTILPGACVDCGHTDAEHLGAELRRAAGVPFTRWQRVIVGEASVSTLSPWEMVLWYERQKPGQTELADALHAEAFVDERALEKATPTMVEVYFPRDGRVNAILGRAWTAEKSLAEKSLAASVRTAFGFYVSDPAQWGVIFVESSAEAIADMRTLARLAASASKGDEGHDGDEER
jgi:hypothetical protein